MSENPELARKSLIDALMLRPSNMLAYQLLSEVYAAADQPDEAASCRKGVLPGDSLPLSGCPAGNDRKDRAGLSVASDQRLSLHSSESISLPPPMGGTKSSTRPVFFNEQAILAKPCFVDYISNGVLWHDSIHTRVFNASGVELDEHAKADRPLIDMLMALHKPYKLTGRVFLIGARGAHNFYHWLADIAPKLGVLLQAGYRFNSDDRFIVPFAQHDFMHQIVAQFGVSADQLYETEHQYAYLQVEKLIVPFVDNKMGLTMGRWVPEVMRENFLHYNKVTGSRRLFVVRESQSADGRQIENQSALQQMLHQFGFEIVTPEKLPVVQQAILFAEAEVVVAAHGAALGNLMFCGSGSVVVELYAGHLAPCYWAISALCGLEYYQVYCDSDNSHDRDQSARRSGNLAVPLTEVELILTKLLA